MTDYLSLEDLLVLVDDLLVGPLRDLGLLDSAAHRPQTSLWGREAYPALDEKAAALLESLVRNHPLVDGNKRLGWLATVVFLDVNAAWVEAPDEAAYDLFMPSQVDRWTSPRSRGHWRAGISSSRQIRSSIGVDRRPMSEIDGDDDNVASPNVQDHPIITDAESPEPREGTGQRLAGGCGVVQCRKTFHPVEDPSSHGLVELAHRLGGAWRVLDLPAHEKSSAARSSLEMVSSSPRRIASASPHSW